MCDGAVLRDGNFVFLRADSGRPIQTRSSLHRRSLICVPVHAVLLDPILGGLLLFIRMAVP